MQHRALLHLIVLSFSSYEQEFLVKGKSTKKHIKIFKNGEKNLALREISRVNLNISEGQPNSIFLELKRQPMFT